MSLVEALESDDVNVGKLKVVSMLESLPGIGKKTAERLLLEVANFHPTTIRRTAVRLGLRTEASARFEKSLDPTLPMQAAAHLVRLLAEIQPSLRLPSPPTDAMRWIAPRLM